ncbi:uncharacterized protein LOC143243847 [Tachypleus tridentatus]|uniref:uncharacterized protein LOC143243847 n=1 Tax=Tachypleus tridentatus TaxID=6853 RepID=UPI003FCFD673
MFHVFNSCNRGSRALILWCVVTFCVKTTQLLPVETNSLNFEVQAEDADIQIIKENILSQLGLDREPDISEVNISQSEMDRVLEIYRRNTRDIRAAPERKRTVRRFYTYRDEVPIQYQFRNGYFRTGRQQVLYFRLDFPGHERSRTRGLTVSSAMLSIYMVHRGSHHQVAGHRGRSNTVSVSDLPKHATIYIYQLQEPVNMENPVGYEESVHVNSSKRFYEPVQAKFPGIGRILFKY